MTIDKRPFQPTYSRGNGLFVINLDSVKDLPFSVAEKSLVNIPPKQFGGNHKHPRWEAFLGLGDGLKLIWQDEKGKTREVTMRSDGGLSLFIVSPNTPHAVINESDTSVGVLLEFASEAQYDVKVVELIS